MLFTSCEMAPPQLEDSGSEAYEKPGQPQNLKVESGYPDKLILTWDKVEEATGYEIYGSRISDIGDGLRHMGSISTNDPTYTFKSSGFDRDQSYVFIVRALKQFPGHKDYLISDDSQKVEGAFAPTRVDVNAVLYPSHVDIYSNSPNLYSGLNTGHESHTLYDAEFILNYGPKGGSSDLWKEKRVEKPDYQNPEHYVSLNINEEGFGDGSAYSFYVEMIIHHEGEEDISIASPILDVVVAGDRLPSPIDADTITVTEGDRSDSIELGWKIPKWVLSATRDNSYFKIERSEAGSEVWDVLVDEINTKIKDDRIVSEDGIACTFLDDSAEKGKTYIYRIMNSAFDDKNIVYVQSETPTVSKEAYLFDEVVEIAAQDNKWNPDENYTSAKPELNISFNTKLPKNLEIVLCYEYYDPVEKAWKSGEERIIESFPYTFDQKLINEKEYNYYRYSLDLRDKTDSSSYTKLDGIEFADMSMMENPILGLYFPVDEDKPFITGVSATKDRNGKIVIDWTENSYEKYPEPYIYSYSIDGGATYLEFVPDEGNEKLVINRTDTGVISISISVVSGKYKYLTSTEGQILSFPATLGFEASKEKYIDSVELTWNGEAKVESLSYYYRMKNPGKDITWSEPVEITDFSAGRVLVPASSLDNYEFSLGVSNTLHPEEGIYYSEVKSGNLLHIPVVTATSGDYSDKVVVSWDPILGKGIESYNVYRSSGSFEGKELVVNVLGEGSGSYEDSAYASDKPYYFVTAVAGGKESLVPASYGNKKNHLGIEEISNLGCLFDASLAEISSIESVVDDEGYITPYLKVTFDANMTLDRIIVPSVKGESSYMLNNLSKVEGSSLYTNGRKTFEEGYVSYDEERNLISVNVLAGSYNTDNIVTVVSVTGAYGNESLKTNTSTKEGSFLRAPYGLEYVNIFNSIVNPILHAADSHFEGDWYTLKSNKYDTTENVIVLGAYDSSGFNSMSPGSVNFSTYVTDVGIALNTITNIELMAYDPGGWNYGYLGTDPLDKLGTNSDKNLTTMTLPETSGYKFRSVDIRVQNVPVRDTKDGGDYQVTVQGSNEMITVVNDSRVTQKIF